MNFDGQENDSKNAGNQREMDQCIEQGIDDALAQFAKVEPRPGLDARVLARLRGAQEASARKFRWWSVLAFGMAVAMVLAAIWIARMDSGRGPASPVAKIPAAAVAGHSDTARSVSPQDHPPQPHPPHAETAQTEAAQTEAPHTALAHAKPGDNAAARDKHGVSGESNPNRYMIASAHKNSAPPMLEHFPSRRKLSEQEWLLLRYLNGQSDTKALLEASTASPEADLNVNLQVDSLEIPPLQIADIEISEDRINRDRTQ